MTVQTQHLVQQFVLHRMHALSSQRQLMRDHQLLLLRTIKHVQNNQCQSSLQWSVAPNSMTSSMPRAMAKSPFLARKMAKTRPSPIC